MKFLLLALLLLPASIVSPALPVFPQIPNPQTTSRYSLRTISPYDPLRIGYESLPVQVIGAGGGKLGPGEKFRIHIATLKNGTQKDVRAVRISIFIFRSDDLDNVVETRRTSLIALSLSAFQTRKVDILAGYADDIPLLIDRPGENFQMELAVTEVHYQDGSIWQGTDLPQKLNPLMNH
jgi:hypothetical protein